MNQCIVGMAPADLVYGIPYVVPTVVVMLALGVTMWCLRVSNGLDSLLMFSFAYSIPLYVTEIGLDLGAISLERFTFELINFCLTNKKIPSHRFRTIWRSHHYCFSYFQ